LALEFTILTASRTGEVIKAKRHEVIENIWTIPGERMKAGKEHRVPIVSRAMDILKIAQYSDPDSEYLFSNNGRPLSSNAMLQLAKHINPDITVHGFRSTFRTWSEEETMHPDSLAKSSLAHTIRDKVDAAYNRGDLFKKRLNLMNEWALFCESNQHNIIEIKAT
jgi:integrase